MGDFAVSDQLRHVENVNLDMANSRPALISTYAYTEMVASTAEDTNWLRVLLCGDNETTSAISYVTIAIGASGSEVDIIEKIACYTFDSEKTRIFVFWLPIPIPAGSRISARSFLGDTTDNPHYVMLQLFNGAPNKSGHASRLVNLVSASEYVTVDPGGTDNTKGAYIELNSSLTNDIHGLILSFSPAYTSLADHNMLFDLAVGSEGSEQVILPDLSLGSSAYTDMIYPSLTHLLPLRVPAGSRLSARAQSRSASSTNVIRTHAWGLE